MSNSNIHISVISPVYRAEKIVDELVKQLTLELEKITDQYEIILVEDGSPDLSWQKIEENCKKHPKLKGLKLSRNFGQHHAVSAGIEASNGHFVIVMDCDLQDNPQDIKSLIDKANTGFDTVLTKRIGRKHSHFKKAFSYIYKKGFSLVSDKNFSLDNGSLLLLNRKVVNAILKLDEKPRMMGQIIRWVGFKIGYVEVKHDKRFEGKSSYTFSKLMTLVWDGWISNSVQLLRIVIYSGIIMSILSFIIGILIIGFKYYKGFESGWASIIVAILFSTGLILVALGVLGLYIGKIFEQTKNRPLYLIDSKINFNE